MQIANLDNEEQLNTNTNYITLTQKKIHFESKESIFKIGKSKQDFCKLLYQYSKEYITIMAMSVDDCDKFGTAIKKIFDEKLKRRLDIGTKYFEGNENDMKKEIFILSTCKDYFKK
jgi:hypothetical protein